MSAATAKLTNVTDTDAKIEQLEGVIAALQEEKRHTALTHRDYIVGLRAQMTTERTELLEISAGFSNALAVLGTKNQKIDEMRGTIRKLRTKLEQERVISADRAKELAALRSSRSWRIGRALTRPLSVFKR